MQKESQNTQIITNRKIFIDNAELINSTVLQIISEHDGNRMPSLKEISERTGLHINTVSKHYKKLKFEPKISPVRSLSPIVIYNIFNLTKTSVSACALWFKIIEGWVERAEVEHSGTIVVQLPKELE
ncbi:MAG: hypothetical protein NT007_12290 [Candidatus Kapabacteria bacterium]|nr:hypothetical protein [Candidatus Kapabacteria bacterium]